MVTHALTRFWCDVLYIHFFPSRFSLQFEEHLLADGWWGPFGGVNGCSDSSLWLADSERSCRYQAVLCERRGREREGGRWNIRDRGREEGRRKREGGRVEVGVRKRERGRERGGRRGSKRREAQKLSENRQASPSLPIIADLDIIPPSPCPAAGTVVVSWNAAEGNHTAHINGMHTPPQKHCKEQPTAQPTDPNTTSVSPSHTQYRGGPTIVRDWSCYEGRRHYRGQGGGQGERSPSQWVGLLLLVLLGSHYNGGGYGWRRCWRSLGSLRD